MLSLGRWPGDPGRKPKLITHQKTKPRGLLKDTSKPFLDHLISFLVAGTTDYDQPSPSLCHSSPTTLSTATHTQTTCRTHVPGLVTCAGYQQHAPHTAVPTAHHGAGGRDWDTGAGGSDVTRPTGFSSNVPVYLSSAAHSVRTTLEKGGLMVV